MGLTDITVQDPTAIKWQSWDLNPALPGSKAHTLSCGILLTYFVGAQRAPVELSLETVGVSGVHAPRQANHECPI